MADRFLINGGGVYTAPADDIWHSLQNQGAGDTFGFNEGADIAKMNAFTVGDFTLAVNMACLGFSTNNYGQTIVMAGNDLDVNGDLQLVGGDVTGTGDISAAGSVVLAGGVDLITGWTGTLILDSGAGNFTLDCLGITIPNLEVNNAPTSFATVDNIVVGDLTYTAGKFTTTGDTVSLIADGVARDVDWDTADYELVHLIIPDNAKMEMTGHVRINALTIGSGVGGAAIASAGGKSLYLYVAANDVWQQTAASGTATLATLYVYLEGAHRQLGYLDGSNITNGVSVRSVGDYTLTLTEDWTMGGKALGAYGNAAGQTVTIDTNGHNILGDPPITLGVAAASNRSGVLDLATGRHAIDTITPGHNDNQNNAIDFATCFVTFANNVTLTNTNPVAVTSTAAIIYGAVTLTDFGCTGWAWAPQATNGGGDGDIIWGTGTSARGRGFMRGAA